MKRIRFALCGVLTLGAHVTFGSVPGLFLTSGPAGQVAVLLGNNTAPFSPGNLAAGWAVAGTGDYDQDGISDIIVSNSATGDVYLWLGGGLGPRPYVGSFGAASAWSILA